MTFLGTYPSIHAFGKTYRSSPVHLAIGVFDGVHLGHQCILKSACAYPYGLSGVLTFSPHPSHILRPQDPTLLLMPFDQQAEHIQSHGIQFIIRHPFTTDFANIPAEDFLPLLKQYIPSLQSIHIGQNFRFGKNRRGDVSLLLTLSKSYNIAIHSIPNLIEDNQSISSSRIRSYIIAADFLHAQKLLGYPYHAQGPIFKKSSHTFLKWAPALKPPYGNYLIHIPGVPSLIVAQYKKDTLSFRTPPSLHTASFLKIYFVTKTK